MQAQKLLYKIMIIQDLEAKTGTCRLAVAMLMMP
jgi:hypothetical protein